VSTAEKSSGGVSTLSKNRNAAVGILRDDHVVAGLEHRADAPIAIPEAKANPPRRLDRGYVAFKREALDSACMLVAFSQARPA
jgi:hypothetical protein